MIHEHPPYTDEEIAAIEAMWMELEEEERQFNEWLNQPLDDPNPHRWH